MEDYIIRKLDFTDSEDMRMLVDLQNTVYKGKHIFDSTGFKHWYIDNPNGKVVSFNAIYNNIMAAHYALVPIQMLINGRIVNGLLSMATVTHPDHRGKGLFKRLAKESYSYAADNGYEFVVGVANANSYPGFIKYFDFEDVGQLEVLLGFQNSIKVNGDKIFKVYWTEESLCWRLKRREYYKDNENVYGLRGIGKIKAVPFLKVILGNISNELLVKNKLKRINTLLRPINLYVGIGSNAKSKGYVKAPKWLKRSPFHLIFLDLTKGTLPKMTKDNVYFQLLDFDVA